MNGEGSSALKISAMQHRVTVRHAFENSKFPPVFYPTMKSRGDASGGSAVAKSVICRTTGWRASRRVGEIFNSLRGNAEETPRLIFFHQAITPAQYGIMDAEKRRENEIYEYFFSTGKNLNRISIIEYRFKFRRRKDKIVNECWYFSKFLMMLFNNWIHVAIIIRFRRKN